MVASFFLTLALACTPYDEFKIMCKARCNFDQDKSHWVSKGVSTPYVCHCGNPVRVDSSNLVIPRNFKVDVLVDSDE